MSDAEKIEELLAIIARQQRAAARCQTILNQIAYQAASAPSVERSSIIRDLALQGHETLEKIR